MVEILRGSVVGDLDSPVLLFFKHVRLYAEGYGETIDGLKK